VIKYVSTETEDGINLYDWLREEDIAVLDSDTGICYVGACWEGFQSVQDDVEDFVGQS
jgi:hypothetical protein